MSSNINKGTKHRRGLVPPGASAHAVQPLWGRRLGAEVATLTFDDFINLQETDNSR